MQQVVVESCEGLSLRGLHSGKQVPPRPYVHYHLLGYQVHCICIAIVIVTTANADTIMIVITSNADTSIALVTTATETSLTC
jgi:hypothetical protein